MGDQDAPDQGQPQDAGQPNQAQRAAPGANPQGESDAAKSIGVSGGQTVSGDATNNIGETVNAYRDQIHYHINFGSNDYQKIADGLRGGNADPLELGRIIGALHRNREPRQAPPAGMPESYEKLVE